MIATMLNNKKNVQTSKEIGCKFYKDPICTCSEWCAVDEPIICDAINRQYKPIFARDDFNNFDDFETRKYFDNN